MRAIAPYRVLWFAAAYVGAVESLELVWDFADAANALMAIPNVVSLLMLGGVAVAETRRYLWSGNSTPPTTTHRPDGLSPSSPVEWLLDS